MVTRHATREEAEFAQLANPAPTLLFVLISLLWELLLLCRFLPFRNIFHYSLIHRSSPRKTNV